MVTGVTPQPTPSIVTRAPAGSVTISRTGSVAGGAFGCWSAVAPSLTATVGEDWDVPEVAVDAAASNVTAGAASLDRASAPLSRADAATG